MTIWLDRILRYPIKSIGVEEIEGASLEQGRALPFDRHWAVTHAKTKVDGGAWGPKINFLIGRSAPALMQVRASARADGRWQLTHPELWHLDIDPDRPEDGLRLIEWLRPLWPASQPAPVTLVAAAEQPLADQSQPYLSLIGQASLDDLSGRIGQRLDRARFRANLWVSGLDPFAEFDLIGRDIRIGEAILRPEKRIERCRATDTNIETGQRDVDMLAELTRHYGHKDLGVFCKVIKGGEIAKNDKVEIL